jgi:hypothetical protein
MSIPSTALGKKMFELLGLAEGDNTYIADSGMGEIILPPSIDGRDRFISLEKITPETVNPLVKRDVSVESVIIL